ncbi:outer membrane beta-barrel protein [Marinobacterium aestuariivivens]|uniref:Outer membrane beta-barrel protein n=1 Tax=Marinobacterium aestuariivivens TaxID=1698799 RepID=A0ABW1ZWX4_9GAMM
MKKALMGLSIVALLSPSIAMAEGAYVGASYGHTELNLSGSDKRALSNAGISFDETDKGYKVFAGYRVNDYFAAEFFYTDLGQAVFKDGVDTLKLEADTVGVAALGMVPINEYVDLYAKVGFHNWDADLNLAGTGISLSDDGTDPVYGAGINYTVNHISVRFEFERYELDDEDVDLISGGVAYNF